MRARQIHLLVRNYLLPFDLRVNNFALMGRPLLVRVSFHVLGPLFDELASLGDVLTLLFSKFVISIDHLQFSNVYS